MLGLGSSLIRGGASLLTYVKDNLKLYLDFKSSRSDTLAFPSEGSTSFDGNTDSILTGAIGDLGSSCTVTFWINRTTVSGSQYVYDARGTSGGGSGYAYFSTGSSTLNNSTGTNYVDGVAGSTVGADGWHFIAITGAPIDIDEDLRIGGRFNSTEWLNAKLANFAIWSRSLSLEEINSVMNKSYSQLGSVEKTSLVSWWALDSQSDSKVLPHDGEILGSELIADGDFALTGTQGASTTGTYWFTNGNMTIADGKAHFADTGGGALDLEGDSPFASTGLYKFQFEVSNTVSGSAKLRIKEGSNTIVLTTYDDGTHQIYFEITSTGGNFQIDPRSSGGVEHDLSNLSLKKVTSNVGVVTGATTTTSVYGGNAPILPRAIDIAESQAEKIGNGSALFGGNTSDDRITIGYNSILSNVGKLSLSAWVKPTVGSTWKGILDKGALSGDTRGEYSIWLTNDAVPKVRFGVNANSSTTTTDDGIPLNEWTHIACTYDKDAGGTNEKKIYINGVLVKEDDYSTAITTNTNDVTIGQYGSLNDYEFAGNIAGVGIWQGVLSQEMVQSLMESTSYAKIPASVKSTLGSEIADTWVNNSTYPFNTFTTSGVNITSGIFDGSGVAISYISFTAVAGKLYKATMNLTLNSGNAPNFRFADSDEGGVGSTGYVANTLVSGTNTFYWKADASATRYFMISINTSIGASNFSLSNLSLKEVTNDLVAYYPLDADSSANGVTNDVTTGEVLGSENITNGDFSSASSWTADSGVSINTTTGKAIFTNAPSVSLYQGIGSSLTGLYKISFDITDYTSGTLQVYGGAEYSYGDAGLLSFTSTGSHVQYVELTSSFNGNIIFGGGTFNGSIDNVSIKEVTSNTGVLK